MLLSYYYSYNVTLHCFFFLHVELIHYIAWTHYFTCNLHWGVNISFSSTEKFSLHRCYSDYSHLERFMDTLIPINSHVPSMG